MSFAQGNAFPTGLFVSDDSASSGGGPDLKLVSWGDVAAQAGLANPDVKDNPHQVTDGGTPDGGVPDGGVPDGGTGGGTSKGSGCSTSGGPFGALLLLTLLGVPWLARRREA
jgi:hypothetical protein